MISDSIVDTFFNIGAIDIRVSVLKLKVEIVNLSTKRLLKCDENDSRDLFTKNPESLSYNFMCLKTQLMYLAESSLVNCHFLNSAMASSGMLHSALQVSR